MINLTKYHLTLLRIIKDNPESSPHLIDRLFYQFRIDEGIAMDKLMDISWVALMQDLKEEGLVADNERSITTKGISYLKYNP